MPFPAYPYPKQYLHEVIVSIFDSLGTYYTILPSIITPTVLGSTGKFISFWMAEGCGMGGVWP